MTSLWIISTIITIAGIFALALILDRCAREYRDLWDD